MNVKPASSSPLTFDELTHEVLTLVGKHNDLIVSLTLLWAEIARATPDPLTKRQCDRRIEELAQLVHSFQLEQTPPVETSEPHSWD